MTKELSVVSPVLRVLQFRIDVVLINSTSTM